MNRDDYRKRVKATRWAVSAWTAAFLAGLAVVLPAADPQIRGYGDHLRGRFGEALGGAVIGLTLAPLPMLVWAAVTLSIDRMLGVRCPHCRRSLTARSLPKRVLETGACSVCRCGVLDDVPGE